LGQMGEQLLMVARCSSIVIRSASVLI